MQAALNGLIEKIWIENAIQDARHHELGLKRRLCGHYSSYWAAKYTSCIKCRKVKFGIKTVLIEPELKLQAIYRWKDN